MSDDKIDGCIFCRITRGEDEQTRLLYQDEQYAVFNDLRPAAKHHLLICPKKHILNAKVLKKDDVSLVEDLVSVAKKVLEEKGADLTKLKLGFHWPPFCTVHHLHLHAITPIDELGFISKGVYASGSPWFAPVEWVLDRLNRMEGPSSGNIEPK